MKDANGWDKHIYKEHNKSLLLYHFVCPVKYRKKIFTEEIENYFVEVCHEYVSKCIEVYFEEIWIDEDHVHFLLQSVPIYSPKRIIQTIKSITAIWIRKKYSWEIEKLWLYWNKFWTEWYYVNTVWQYGNYDTIRNYVKNQWKNYKQVYKNPYKITSLFEWMQF